MIFYDTCALLNKLHGAFNERFEVSTITFRELENIKTSANKDPEIKFRARRAYCRLLKPKMPLVIFKPIFII